MHWLVAAYFGHGKPRQKARILRGPAANEQNVKGVDALIGFLEQIGPAIPGPVPKAIR